MVNPDLGASHSPTQHLNHYIKMIPSRSEGDILASMFQVLLLNHDSVFQTISNPLKVCKTRRTRNGDREIYIEKNPNCRLTPDQEYTLSTDLTDEHHIDPKVG